MTTSSTSDRSITANATDAADQTPHTRQECHVGSRTERKRTDDRITVLHLCEHFGGEASSLHGPARIFQWWFRGFDTSRFRVLLCSRKGYDRAAAEMERSGLEPLYLGYGKMDPRNLFKLTRLVRRENVDVIHAHGIGASLWARLVGRRFAIPVIIHGHANYGKIPFYMRPVEFTLGRWTDHAFAVSESTRHFLIHKRYMPEAVVQLLYTGMPMDTVRSADAATIDRIRREQGLQPGDTVIGVVGRIVSHKGHLDAFEAMTRVVAKHPNTYLWVVGDGDYLPALKSWLTQHSAMEKHIRFLGFRQDVIDVIQCFDIQLFPSHLEGTPGTLFEAFAVGNTMVATPTDGQKELLEDGQTGLMCKVGDPEDMAKKLIRVLDSPDLARTLGQHARARSADFDGRNCIATLETAYERLARRNGSPASSTHSACEGALA